MDKAPDLNVITVVDPDEKTEIEIRPQELLQVVFTDWKIVSWRYEDQVSSIRLRPLRHETYYCDGYERNRDSNFQVLAHTQKYGAHQHHFWFRVNPSDCKKVQELERSYNELATIIFEDEEKDLIGRVHVWLITEKEDKDDFFGLLERTIFTGKDPIAQEGQIEGLSNRLIDEEHGYVLNPGWDEQVVFETRQRMMLIELAEPPHAKNLKWKACATRPDNGQADFGMTELSARFINGIRVQRFLIKNYLQNLPMGVEKVRLGDVRFRLAKWDGTTLEGNRWEKKINFFIVREREPETYFGGEEEYDEEEACHYLRQVETWCRPHRLRKVPVQIEELDIKGDLKAGARLIRVFSPTFFSALPQIDRKKTYEIVDPNDQSVVMLPVGEELVVHLYKDTMKNKEWMATLHGKMLKANYIITDDHRQRFFFEIDPKSNANGEVLTFTMNGREKKVHVFCTGQKVVQEVKYEYVDDKDVEKVVSELLNNPKYDWRTVTSLSIETDIAQTKVVDVLDKLNKEGIVREHPNNAGVWGHSKRIGINDYDYVEDI